MGPEDSNDFGQLYLTTKDGHKVPMTATALCIPDLISADMTEEDTESDDIEQKEKPLYIESVNQEANTLAHGINILCVSLVLFLILVLVVVAYHFLI